MDRILIILKKENDPRASSAPALGLNTIIFKHVYWYLQQTQVSVYRTIGPLVLWSCTISYSMPHKFSLSRFENFRMKSSENATVHIMEALREE